MQSLFLVTMLVMGGQDVRDNVPPPKDTKAVKIYEDKKSKITDNVPEMKKPTVVSSSVYYPNVVAQSQPTVVCCKPTVVYCYKRRFCR